MEELNTYNNSTPGLEGISDLHYENIFKVVKDGEYFTYNILQHITLPADMDPLLYREITMPPSMPLSVLSYRVYGTMNLWWLICVVNNIDDPTKMIPSGTKIKVIKPDYLGNVMDIIKNQLPK